LYNLFYTIDHELEYSSFVKKNALLLKEEIKYLGILFIILHNF